MKKAADVFTDDDRHSKHGTCASCSATVEADERAVVSVIVRGGDRRAIEGKKKGGPPTLLSRSRTFFAECAKERTDKMTGILAE